MLHAHIFKKLTFTNFERQVGEDLRLGKKDITD